MGRVSHKLKNSLEGALAGGGDPATSPLYVFGPFLKLIVVAGVANVTFGSSVWLAVITIAVISAVYRLVMRWVTDGSGGSGMSEEEFGSFAGKINAAITFVEYTLTFLVSMAAMVTFISDRFPVLNESILGIKYRTFVAVLLSIVTGWLVNRGPKVATRTFGPATVGVLLLLWAMIISTLLKTGFHLPTFNLEAFSPQYLKFTIGGYVRILAVMTGIEVFANLVAAYDGTPAQKGKKAFNSLLIIMGTTAVTMLIVGPAILRYSDPINTHVSVFTQTMDQLLPDPLPYLGTLVGVAVLMSASAASAQSLQNLALGLKERHYIPPILGERNQFDVADKPVWIEVGVVSLCFFIFGTHEEIYLAIYAAGVFIILSLTSWAVTKRLIRNLRENYEIGKVFLVCGTVLAASLTTGATISIFIERFIDGAWTYFLFIPILFAFFTYFRNRLGAPDPIMDYLGQIDASALAGFGFGQSLQVKRKELVEPKIEISWQPDPIEKSIWREHRVSIKRVAVLLDGSPYAAQAIPMAKKICSKMGAHLTLFSALKDGTASAGESTSEEKKHIKEYLCQLSEEIAKTGISVNSAIRTGSPTDAAKYLVDEQNIDIIITTTRGKSGEKNWLTGGLSSKLVQKLDIPVLLVQTSDDESDEIPSPEIDRILVALDGSIYSEQTLPYARVFAKAFGSKLSLLSVPAVPESENYRAPANMIQTIRTKAEINMKKFNEAVARSLRMDDIEVRSLVTGSIPARAICEVAEEEDVDLIMITSKGRGGLDLFFMGSVAQVVVQRSKKPVFIMPITMAEVL
ncbi:MAG: universal stress protein [Anaerolineaceae bacterium]|nr:universal stress protein [Anaerolineaceae bacterium]